MVANLISIVRMAQSTGLSLARIPQRTTSARVLSPRSRLQTGPPADRTKCALNSARSCTCATSVTHILRVRVNVMNSSSHPCSRYPCSARVLGQLHAQ